MRRFLLGVAIGVAAELAVAAMEHAEIRPVTVLAEWGADLLTRLGAALPGAGPPAPRQVLVDIDDETWRDPGWGGGEPGTAPAARIGELVEEAFSLGAAQVVVDVDIVDRPSASAATDVADEREGFAPHLRRLLREPGFRAPRQLVLLRSLRQPLHEGPATGDDDDRDTLADGYLPELRGSPAIDAIVAASSGRIVVGAPYFRVGADGLLRRWDLASATCERTADAGDGARTGRIRIVPSAQLVVAARLVDPRDRPLSLPPPAGACVPFPRPTDARRDGDTPDDRARRACALARQLDGEDAARHRPACTERAAGTAPGPQGLAPAGLLRAAFATLAPDPAVRRRLQPRADHDDVSSRIVFDLPDGRVTRVPAIQLLDAAGGAGDAGAIAPLLRGAIVVIGQTFQEAGDRHDTPVGAMPGALVIMNAIDSLTRRGVLHRPGPLPTAAFTTLIILLTAALTARFPSAGGTVLATAAVLALGGWLALRWSAEGLWLDVVGPATAIQVERWLHAGLHSVGRWRGGPGAHGHA